VDLQQAPDLSGGARAGARRAYSGVASDMRAIVVALGIATLLSTSVAGCSSSSDKAAKDVTITACTASPSGGHPRSSGVIVNHSSKASLYTIHVKFTDASGNGVGDGLAAVARVETGATANW